MTLTLRLLSPLLIFSLACAPKLPGDDDDGGESTAGEAEGTEGASTSGDQPSTGNSDPTMPATSSAEGGSAETTTQPGTSIGTITVTVTDTSADEVTSASGSVSSIGSESETATDTMTTGPIEPPQPCEGDALPIEATTIMAYAQKQIPPEPDPTMSGTTDVPDPPNPDTMFLKFSSQVYMCEDPNAALQCGPQWEFTISIPPEFQVPGVYGLNIDPIFASSAETGAPDPNNPDECSFGGGGGFGGTFELIKVTDTTVEGRLCNVEAFFLDTAPDLDGTFVADRC